MKQKSPLGKRILEQVRQLPFENSPKFQDEVINKTCRPKGYFAVTDPAQFRDFYNFCIFNLIKASEENKGTDIDNILFDQPLVSLTLALLLSCVYDPGLSVNSNNWLQNVSQVCKHHSSTACVTCYNSMYPTCTRSNPFTGAHNTVRSGLKSLRCLLNPRDRCVTD